MEVLPEADNSKYVMVLIKHEGRMAWGDGQAGWLDVCSCGEEGVETKDKTLSVLVSLCSYPHP